MFSFLNKSPEEKLKQSLNKLFEDAIKEALRSSPNEMFSGSFITLAIGNCYKTCNEKALSISRYYKLPLNTVDRIIKECTNNMFSKYLDNAKDYFV